MACHLLQFFLNFFSAIAYKFNFLATFFLQFLPSFILKPVEATFLEPQQTSGLSRNPFSIRVPRFFLNNFLKDEKNIQTTWTLGSCSKTLE